MFPYVLGMKLNIIYLFFKQNMEISAIFFILKV